MKNKDWSNKMTNNLDLNVCEVRLKEKGLNDKQISDLKDKLYIIAKIIMDNYQKQKIKN